MNFIRTLLNCCAGFRYYRQLLTLNPIESIKFLAGVILLVVVVQIGTFVPVLRNLVEQGADWVQMNLPRFEIKNGQAHYDSPEPFVYSNEVVRIAIDTTGDTNTFQYTAPYGLFIGRDHLRFGIALEDRRDHFTPTKEEQRSLKNYPNGVVNAEYVRALATPWLWRIAPYGILLYFFGWLLGMLIQAYIFTLVISLAESTTLKKFGFNEFFNIAAHACAPASIVVTSLIVSRTYRFEWLLLAFLATYFIYVMGATAACRRDESEEQDDDESL